MSRVSSDEQAKGYSLDIQVESISKWCVENNVTIVKTFREDHSAKDFNRPQWRDLKTYASANSKSVDMLLVTTWDRFSRNTTDAFVELLAFKKMGIEVQAIQQPIDFNIPESKVLLAIYLTLPEIDNDRRSMKIREGIRAALRSGRWSRKAPVGYSNIRDSGNKPHIVINENSYLIKFAFEEISKGATQEYVRKIINKKGLNVSKNNMSLLLRNLVYIGKIRVPSSEKEPEEILEGLHDAIIDIDLFYKVQEQLKISSAKKNKPKQNATREELPLRGILSCSKCGNKVTGSASRSKTGARHFYYHCNSCKKERYKASAANECIENFLNELEFSEAIKSIYSDMRETLNKGKQSQKSNNSNILKKIELLKNRLSRLQDLLIDGVMTSHDYNNKNEQYQKELRELNAELNVNCSADSGLKSKIEKGINLMTNAREIYLKATVVEKQRLISSIFPEKLEFSENKCRTPRINDLLLYMLLKNNKLWELKKGQFNKNIELSRQVESGRIELTLQIVLFSGVLESQ